MPVKRNKRKKNEKVILTAKQKNLVKIMSNNIGAKKTMWEMMREAGYSESMSENPRKILVSSNIQQALVEMWIDDKKLAKKQKEHLEARKIEFRNFWEYEEIPENKKKCKELEEEIQFKLESHIAGAKLLSIKKRTEFRKNGDDIDYIEARYSIPDYTTQRDVVKDLNKIFGNYAPEKHEHKGSVSLLWLFWVKNDENN